MDGLLGRGTGCDPDKVKAAHLGGTEEEEPRRVGRCRVGVGESGDGLGTRWSDLESARGEMLRGLVVVFEQGPSLDDLALGERADRAGEPATDAERVRDERSGAGAAAGPRCSLLAAGAGGRFLRSVMIAS